MHDNWNKSNVVCAALSAIAALVSAGFGVWSVHESRSQHREMVDLARQAEEDQRKSTLQREKDQQAFTLQLEQARTERERPNLTDNSDAPSPIGVRPGATFAAVKNAGKQQALVTKITYSVGQQLQTPKDVWPMAAAPEPGVSVFFTEKDLAKDRHSFVRVLDPPIGVPGGDDLVFRVAIVHPAWVGKTYRGDLTVFFDKGQSIRIPDVTLDVSPVVPPK